MIYRFKQIALDTKRFRLCRENQQVSVEPMVFAILEYLIRNRDRVVSRDELLENLWQGKVVTESAVNARIKSARQAVGDSGDRQEIIKTFHGRGYQFIAEISQAESDAEREETPGQFESDIGLDQQTPVRFCRANDGINIAHAQVGSGPPLVMTGSWMSHLEEDWVGGGWAKFLSELARDFTLIRYDMRGNGMSDWDDVDISFARLVEDLGSIVDCYDYEQVAIFGPSASAAVSIAYSLENPGKVSRLVLYGGYARGKRRRGDAGSRAESEAMATLIREAWGRDNPMARQMMTTLYTPDASQEEAEDFNEFQKICAPAENIARFLEVYDDIDISELLDQVVTPTLVIHCVGDSVSPYSQGKLLASSIPGASFASLNSNDHLISDTDPEFPRLLHKVREFLLS